MERRRFTEFDDGTLERNVNNYSCGSSKPVRRSWSTPKYGQFPPTRLLVLFVGVFLVTGCSTHMVHLRYDIPDIGVNSRESSTRLRVAPFRDERGTGTDWLGAVRGGFGNPLKKLRTNAPTSELVTQAVRDAIVARGLTVQARGGDLIVTGVLIKLDCSLYMNREAHAHLLFEVRDPGSGDLVFSKIYAADQVEGGVGGGIFASVERLRNLAERTMREAVDKAVDDPEFLRVVGAGG